MGKENRFGKPGNFDMFNIKNKEFVPSPDAYFYGNILMGANHLISQGFSFGRSERKMHNQDNNQSNSFRYDNISIDVMSKRTK
jgi:hypothetical protein